MLLFGYELKKIFGKLRLFTLGCFAINLLGVSSLWSYSNSESVVHSALYSTYLPNLTLECAILALLLTHSLIGFEYSNRTENVVYSTATGRKCLCHKLAAAVAAVLIYSGLLFCATIAAYFIMGGTNTDWSLFAKVIPISFGIILLFALFAFAAGLAIRNPWVAVIMSASINTAWVGVVMNFPDEPLLRLPLMGLVISQKAWYTDFNGTLPHFELIGFALTGIVLTASCLLAYKIFRRRDIL